MIMKQCGKFYYAQAPSPRTEASNVLDEVSITFLVFHLTSGYTQTLQITKLYHSVIDLSLPFHLNYEKKKKKKNMK